jgi:DNA polymerase V
MLSEKVFRKNINFIKAGVMLSDFYDEGVYQGDLFRAMSNRSGSKELMLTVDKINSSGIGKITFAAQGIKKTWSMKRFLQSPRYLTSWEEMPIVK